MIMKLYGFILYIWRLIKSALVLPVRRLARAIRKSFNMRSRARKIVMKAKESIQEKARVKPSSIDDYVAFRRKYVAKSLFVLVPLLVVVLVIVFFMYGQPWIISKFFTAVFYEDNEKIPTYNGKVRILEKENEKPLFEGRLENGLKKEYGKIYDRNANVIYEGGFLNDLYEGFGKLYNQDGKLIYEGYFSSGMMEGAGTSFNPENNRVTYKGGFSASQFDGEGVAYYDSGVVAYKGAFAAGEKSGQGTEYYEDGTIRYKGAFSGNSYSGYGVLYDPSGAVQYEGDFQDNAFNGKGKLYSEGGAGRYEGDFTAGKPHGSGTIYHNGFKTYEGEMFSGMKQGMGKLFTQYGAVFYEGVFSQDEIPFADLIGRETKEIVASFTGKAGYTMFENDFLLMTAGAGCAFLINYADRETPAAVRKIYLWEQDNSGLQIMRNKNLDMAKTKELMGEPSAEGDTVPDMALLTAAGASGFEPAALGKSLSFLAYLVDGYEYRFHYRKDSGEFVALTIGEVPG